MRPEDGQTWGPIIGIGVAAVVMIFRMRSAKPKPLRVATMWIIPLLLLTGFVLLTATSHLGLVDYVWVVLALALGSALGWQRGRMMPITVDPETHQPLVKVSPAALVFLLALMAVRVLLRQVVQSEATAWHINPLLVTDAFMAFAVGFLGVARIEMFVRARRLIDEARGQGKIVS